MRLFRIRSRALPGWGLSSARISATVRTTSRPEGRSGSRPPREKPPYLGNGLGVEMETEELGGGAGQQRVWERDRQGFPHQVPSHLTSSTHFLVFRLQDTQGNRVIQLNGKGQYGAWGPPGLPSAGTHSLVLTPGAPGWGKSSPGSQTHFGQ